MIVTQQENFEKQLIRFNLPNNEFLCYKVKWLIDNFENVVHVCIDITFRCDTLYKFFELNIIITKIIKSKDIISII